jgi:membrane associated rhomboid family serine protease
MTSLNYDLRDKLKRLTAFEKIIAINLVVYVVGWLIYATGTARRDNSLAWLELPKDFFDFLQKPWSIITYGFAHLDFWHIGFNMLILYFVGRSFSNLFKVKLSLNVYFLGILLGGLLYMLVYNLFPNGLLKSAGPLIGASAGVRATIIFLCAYMPGRDVHFGPVRIRLLYIGLIIVGLDFIGLFGDNAGGYLAHLGGNALGYFYAVQLQKGRDVGKGFERFMDAVSRLFSRRRAHLKTVHRSRKKQYAGHTKEEFDEFNKQKKIDIILDKIGKSGYESLSKEEKEFLFKAGKK